MQLFTQIHEICFYGEGGYDWETVYKMPIWLRKYTFNKIQEHYAAKNNEGDNSDSWLSGEAREVAAQNKKMEDVKKIKVPSFITNPGK